MFTKSIKIFRHKHKSNRLHVMISDKRENERHLTNITKTVTNGITLYHNKYGYKWFLRNILNDIKRMVYTIPIDKNMSLYGDNSLLHIRSSVIILECAVNRFQHIFYSVILGPYMKIQTPNFIFASNNSNKYVMCTDYQNSDSSESINTITINIDKYIMDEIIRNIKITKNDVLMEYLKTLFESYLLNIDELKHIFKNMLESQLLVDQYITHQMINDDITHKYRLFSDKYQIFIEINTKENVCVITYTCKKVKPLSKSKSTENKSYIANFWPFCKE